MTNRHRLIALIAASALFMQTLDSTVLGTALPAIAADFGIPAVRLHLAITGYLLALAVCMPLSGWLVDTIGTRRVFCAAIAVFSIASILCAFATSLETLVAARVLQGMGGAMMLPVARLAVLRSVPKSEVVRALTWVAVPGLIGPLVGPPLGGFMVDYLDWTWIFWINVPIGLVGIGLAAVFIDDVTAPERRPFDAPGFVMTSIAVVALLLLIETLGGSDYPAWLVWPVLAAGPLAAFGYWRRWQRIDHAVIDLSLLKYETFRASVVGGNLFRFGIGAIPFVLPLMLQEGFGNSAFASGLITFSSAGGAIFIKFGAPRLLRRFGFRKVLIWNAVLAALSVAAMAAFSAGTAVWVMIAVLFVGGVFRSLQFTALNSIAFAELGHDGMGRATGFYALTQQLSLSIGVGIAAMTLQLSDRYELETSTGLGGYALTLLIIAGLMLSSAFLFTRLDGNAGAEMANQANTAGGVHRPATDPRA